MTWHNKVMWTEGMFLQPQHFQQLDRFVGRQLDARIASAVPWPWGYVALQLDDAALLQGRVMLTAARGVLPDGLAFSIPGDDPAPPAMDVPADARDELVVLAVPQSRPGVPESDVEATEGSMPPRWRVADVDAADIHAASLREAPLQVGRLNLRLLLARDANEGYITLGTARIVERRADGRVVLDSHYVPPMLHAPAQPVLDGYVREVHGMLHQRGEAIGGRLAQPGRAGTGEIVDFLLLQAVNRHQGLFAHLQRLPVLHPERLYELCLGLAGELATFREQRRPPAYPEYRHDDLAGCFRVVMADLRQSLSMVLEQTAIPIELQERKYGMRVAIISDVRTAARGDVRAGCQRADARRGAAPALPHAGQDRPGRAHPRPGPIAVAGCDAARPAGGAAADSLPRRLHLFRARDSRQRTVEAARKLRRPAGHAHCR